MTAMDGRRWFLVLLSVAALMGPGVCLAQTDDAGGGDPDARAREAFQEGQAHYDAGRFGQAVAAFQRSYRLSGRIQLLYNIYLALRDDGQLEEARDALREFVERRELPPTAPESRRLAALERRLVEDAEAAAAAGAAEGSSSDESGEAAASTQSRASTQSSSGLMIPGVILVATGGAALIIGGALVGVAFADESAIESPDGLPTWTAEMQAAADRVPVLAGAGDVLLAVGAAALVAGVVLMVVDPGGRESQARLHDGRLEVRF